MYFSDRYDAAMQLIPHLEKYRKEEGVVLAVPRGGVPVGYILAKHLDFSLDLLMTKKISHPLHKEYAIGAVGIEGEIVEDFEKIPHHYIEQEIRRIRQQLCEGYKKFMENKEPLELQNKTVVVVDDGIATGRTILASIKIIKTKKPKTLVVAVPVSSEEAAQRISKEVDDFVCLYIPPQFYGVGGYYSDFTQITDDEVRNLLKQLTASDHAA
jgi:predicted phosphoribosyltransferase